MPAGRHPNPPILLEPVGALLTSSLLKTFKYAHLEPEGAHSAGPGAVRLSPPIKLITLEDAEQGVGDVGVLQGG